MNKLFEKEGQSIFCFKKGDVIIQLKSSELKKSIYNENLGICIEVTYAIDGSFREEPVKFIAIENNIIYLESFRKSYDNSKIIHKVKLEYYGENWALFIVPNGLTFEECISKY